MLDILWFKLSLSFTFVRFLFLLEIFEPSAVLEPSKHSVTYVKIMSYVEICQISVLLPVWTEELNKLMNMLGPLLWFMWRLCSTFVSVLYC